MMHPAPSLWRSRAAKRLSRGLTLTELAIVLGGVGLVMGVIWGISSVVWDSYRLQQAQDQLITVVQNVRNYYDPIGRIYANPSAKTLYADGDEMTADLDSDDRRLIPSDMRTTRDASGSDIQHALSSTAGGSFVVRSESNGLRFAVALAGLSQTNCIKLLMQFPLMSPEMGVTRVSVNGGDHDLNANNPAAPGDGFPMNLETASDWCDIADSKTNEVTFVFKLKN